MGYYYKAEPENAVPAKSWATPKTHVPGSPVKERGHRYFNPEVGRWASRDPIGENGGLNLLAFVLNDPMDSIDYLGLIQQQQDDCLKMNRKEFEQWLIEHGVTIDSFITQQLNRGCIGLTCIDQGNGGDPEDRPDTKCWMDEPGAQSDCKRCKNISSKPCCTVFAKQGKWKNDKPPKKRPDGSIGCHEVVSTKPGQNYWNYVLSKQGWYFYANNMAGIPGSPQWFKVCKSFPEFSDLPATMWGTTCHKSGEGIPPP